jgi:hypothetical protein
VQSPPETGFRAKQALSLIALFVFLMGSIAVFAYQVVHYTTLLG